MVGVKEGKVKPVTHWAMLIGWQVNRGLNRCIKGYFLFQRLRRVWRRLCLELCRRSAEKR